APSETVFVGDSDVDVKTGNNAGMRVIGVSWGYRGHDFLMRLGSCEVADTVDELAQMLG
ncbi:MAG: HAD hydrolase-like protein, partial [Clostridia bacterium]|nr:HAD hydrolase-like protein [Clostridia bacterium]